ncbi:AAA family ATPase [Agromyces intestinalis]|nr:AAA family ATPase [Agromyces intestinalis]
MNAEKGEWNCLSSGGGDHGGSIYDLVRELGLQVDAQARREGKSKPSGARPKVPPKLGEELLEKVMVDWPAMLAADREGEVWRFLTEARGLDPQTIADRSLGMDGAGNLTIPIRHVQTVRNIRYRAMRPNPRNPKRYWSADGHGSPAVLYPTAELVGNTLPVLLTESELDAILANQIGAGRFVAVSGTGGAGVDPADLSSLAGREVFIGYDNDDAGEKGGHRIAEKLRKLGAQVYTIDWLRLGLLAGDKTKKDFTDWVMKLGGTADVLLKEMERLRSEEAYDAVAEFEADVEEVVRRKEINREAERRLAAKTAAGSFSEFVKVSLREALERPREVKPALIESLQMQGHKAFLTAQFKAGKTTLAGNVVRSMADGEPFLNRFEVFDLRGNVGVFDYELTEDDALDLYGSLGLRRAERVFMQSLRGTGFTLANEHHRDLAVNWLIEHDVQYWVVDPFGRALRGFGSENDNDDVRVFLDTLDRIVTEASLLGVLMPVHTGRAQHEIGAEHGRGATVVDDDADARWILTKDTTGRRFFRAEGRNGVGLDEVSLEFDPSTSQLWTGDLSRAESAGERFVGLVLNHIEHNPGVSLRELKKDIEGADKNIAAAVKLAIRRGFVRMEQDGQAHRHYIETDPRPKLRVTVEGPSDE